MTYGSGIGAQLGYAAESTYGVRVAPTRFAEFLSAQPSYSPTWVVRGGLGAGRLVQDVTNTAQRVKTQISGGLNVTLEVCDTDFGLILAHILGGTVTTAAAGALFSHAYALGSAQGKSLTAQLGVPQTNGTVKPFDLVGCKITQADFTCEVGGLLQVSLTIDARDVDESQTLAAPSLAATPVPFHHAESTVTVGGVTLTGVRRTTLSLQRSLNTDRTYMGAAGRKAEPIENGWAQVSWSFDMDYVDHAQISALHATGQALSVEWSLLKESGATDKEIAFASARAFVEGDTPGVSGPDVVQPTVNLRAYQTGATAALTAEYVTADATP